MRDDYYLLQSAKGIRNACGHNLCANAHNVVLSAALGYVRMTADPKVIRSRSLVFRT